MSFLFYWRLQVAFSALLQSPSVDDDEGEAEVQEEEEEEEEEEEVVVVRENFSKEVSNSANETDMMNKNLNWQHHRN